MYLFSAVDGLFARGGVQVRARTMRLGYCSSGLANCRTRSRVTAQKEIGGLFMKVGFKVR